MESSPVTCSNLLELINNSSSLNKGNRDRNSVWISYLLRLKLKLAEIFYDFISPFSPYIVLLLTEKI